MRDYVTIVGAGLAGAEAAWQAAQLGVHVRLYEMRPVVGTPVHQTGNMAELVCSNSLRSNALERGPGLLKEEMRRLGSLILRSADAHSVPAGTALAVDRVLFGGAVTDAVEQHPLITVERCEITEVPTDRPCVVATGPLTSDALSDALCRTMREATGSEEFLYFFDAVSPIVETDTINHDRVFEASRYGKGEAAYLNCPMNEIQYDIFRDALLAAEKASLHEFERKFFFEGCLPIEELAERGRDTMRFGPMKPVGLLNPKSGNTQPFAVVQLRQENSAKTLYNLVGFQTRLTWPEQTRVFHKIPGLEGAEFARYGVIHRNTFINSPRVLKPTYEFCPDGAAAGLFFAGQITGVEGYIESAASGLIAGLNAALLARGEDAIVFPPTTALGALSHYISTADPEHFQPMNFNFGLLIPLDDPPRSKKLAREMMVQRALKNIKEIASELDDRRTNSNSTP